ncbi:hypothetical protein P3T76_015504 [Phytophthora citrophthora]|uniref:Uncharacterized protein n=1 Tax=Phytophthora citrophthora TaxID=4793 RepID=A0AAD9LBE4_9STRA|nr:hypothetical protein P3T76_015504 [Phytophthora citrophthora]
MSGPAATLLPTSIRDIRGYRVIMAGSFTTEQLARVRQMHPVHRLVVEDLLAFYCKHNVMYENVAIYFSDLAVETVVDDLKCAEIDAEVDANDVDTESDHVSSTVELGDADGETNLVERRVVFIADDREVNTQGTPDAAVQVVGLPSQLQSLIRHAS